MASQWGDPIHEDYDMLFLHDSDRGYLGASQASNGFEVAVKNEGSICAVVLTEEQMEALFKYWLRSRDVQPS